MVSQCLGIGGRLFALLILQRNVLFTEATATSSAQFLAFPQIAELIAVPPMRRWTKLESEYVWMTTAGSIETLWVNAEKLQNEEDTNMLVFTAQEVVNILKHTIPSFAAQAMLEGFAPQEKVYVKLGLADLYRYALCVSQILRKHHKQDLTAAFNRLNSLYVKIIYEIMEVYPDGAHKLTMLNLRARFNWATLHYYGVFPFSKLRAIRLLSDLIAHSETELASADPLNRNDGVERYIEFAKTQLTRWRDETHGPDGDYEIIQWNPEIVEETKATEETT